MPRHILKEDGDELLLESGSFLLLEDDWEREDGGASVWTGEPGTGGQSWAPQAGSGGQSWTQEDGD